MRLEPLFDATWTYTLLQAIQPSSAGDGYVYGQGSGTLTGRVNGRAEWSNFPRLHQGYAFPDARGVIMLEPDGFVLFTLTGLSSLADGSGIHTMMFKTEHEPHLWLNQVIAVGEGAIDAEAGVLVMRYYTCEVDLAEDRTEPAAGRR